MPGSFNGLAAADSLRGVEVRDANGFLLTECPGIGQSEMVLLHRAGINSVLSMVNASPTDLASILGCGIQEARDMIAWAVEASYPSSTNADSEVVEAYRAAGLSVLDADPLAAAMNAAETARAHREPINAPGGLNRDGTPAEPEEDSVTPMQARQSTGFSRIRVEGGVVSGESGNDSDTGRLDELQRRGKATSRAVPAERR